MEEATAEAATKATTKVPQVPQDQEQVEAHHSDEYGPRFHLWHRSDCFLREPGRVVSSAGSILKLELPARMVVLAANAPCQQRIEQLLFLGLAAGIVPQIADFVGIISQVEQLAVFGIQEVDQLPVARSDHGLEIIGREVHVPSRLAENLIPALPRLALQRT